MRKRNVVAIGFLIVACSGMAYVYVNRESIIDRQLNPHKYIKRHHVSRGMTYEEVCRINGTPEVFATGVSGSRDGTIHGMVASGIYAYESEEYPGSMLSFVTENDVVTHVEYVSRERLENLARRLRK